MKLKTWISPKTKKGLPSKIHGIGILATELIKKDELLIIKDGHIITGAELKNLNFDCHPEIQVADDLFISPSDPSELEDTMAYINHSCNPNVGMRGDIASVAMRDIEAGEELTMDYAMIDNQEYSMTCVCGSVNCRKTLTGQDYRLPDVKKYGKYLSAYIQSKLGIIS